MGLCIRVSLLPSPESGPEVGLGFVDLVVENKARKAS